MKVLSKSGFHTPFLVLILMSFWFAGNISAQTTAVKSNIMGWGSATPNAGIEFKIGNRGSVDFMASFNPFEFSDDSRFKHWLIQQEYRWWFCETFSKHFLGVHTHFSQYNVGGWDIPLGRLDVFKDNRYEGYLYGGGLSYGYQWVLGTRWNLEFNIGGGYARIDYDEYGLDDALTSVGSGFYDYWGITRAGLSLIYFLK